VGFLTGVLNSFDKFAVPAFAPAVLNLVLIGATIYVCPRLGTSDLDHVTGLAWFVVAAGALEALVFAPVLWRLGYRFRFLPQLRAEPVRALFRLLVPGLIGAGVYQFAVLINRLMAGWLGADAVTSLYYSERLVYLPIGVFSVALTGACLPIMSRAFAQGRPGEMLEALFYSIRHTLFLSLPCVLGLVILGDRVVNLILRYGKFDDPSFVATMAALQCYALGIPAVAALKILRSGFFSRQDTRTPLKVSVTCLALNLALDQAYPMP
jgi:putative peptidoglycan lipid II flippase